jgi:hypothetical protein
MRDAVQKGVSRLEHDGLMHADMIWLAAVGLQRFGRQVWMADLEGYARDPYVSRSVAMRGLASAIVGQPRLDAVELQSLDDSPNAGLAVALHCDILGVPEMWANHWDQALRKGGHAITYALLEAVFARERGCPLPRSPAYVARLEREVAALIVPDGRTSNLEIEAAWILTLAGRGSMVARSFLGDVLDAQWNDGGWAVDETKRETGWEPTAHAVLWLTEQLDAPKAGILGLGPPLQTP